MASHVVGGMMLRNALRRLPADVRAEVAVALRESIELVQQTAIALAPRRTGQLHDALADPRAIGVRDKGMEVEFGFRTKAIQKKAFYAPFVEFGTKGYSPGDYRKSGVDRHGRQLYKRIKRNIPPRPARPFMRPALDLQIPAIRIKMDRAVRTAMKRYARNVGR